MRKIGLGGGCHWCTEAIFNSLKGVQKVEQGWLASNGSHSTFSEGIIVTFDPNLIELKTLIEIHLHTHSCTKKHSMREKYRSAVYIFNEEDFQDSKAILKALQTDFEEEIITQVLPFEAFKLNIEDQLNYYYKNPEKPFCETFINPKLNYILKQFSDQVDTEKLQHLKINE
ncbi:peptide-methionine (S)-S-oxide reductase [Chryseobacterium ginsenosidimutans]|jgi:peptide-methionine (S)-S-oxide reductase|uniref:peptide-methionine (S)-S-oxide reductase n=1 Tax=Chryseobacterium ginsenosidimutans TaxID=687846 RepID=UPI0021696EA9|nr:peptide-methionine (S)-S-oxide reductase [Chryseobacterium ginsenosidimutans]MCS3870560.1 peptide-methionine (S)-S-oxide reductase [Chryseobacterium ginsenosidimutans]